MFVVLVVVIVGRHEVCTSHVEQLKLMAYSDEKSVYRIGSDLYAKYAEWLPDDVLEPLSWVLESITRAETTIFQFPQIDWDIAHLTLKEQVDLRRFLRAKQYFHTHEERIVALFQDGVGRLLEVLTYGAPQTSGPSPFTVPIVNTLNEQRLLIDRLYERQPFCKISFCMICSLRTDPR